MQLACLARQLIVASATSSKEWGPAILEPMSITRGDDLRFPVELRGRMFGAG